MLQTSSTQECLCFMLILAQCFGLLPVCGIARNNSKALQFKWRSKRCLYSILFLLLASLNTLLHVLKMITEKKAEFGNFVTLAFFAVTIVIVAIFIQVARRWPFLMEKWSQVDKAMGSYGFPVNLNRQLKTVAVAIFTGAIVEHSLFLCFVVKTIRSCNNFGEFFQLYVENNFNQIFKFIPYSVPLGIVAQLVNIYSTATWNFMDLFIMIISITLSARFKQVALRIKDLSKNNVKDIIVWRKVREDYTKLVSLSLVVDDTISTTLLVSLTNNILVVLVQLYFSLERPPVNGVLDKIYYFYSFLFLVLRTGAVVLCSATINVESKKPQYYLSTLGDDVYNIEIERFLYQIKYNTVALTGYKLFTVTKTLILSIAKAIVSYELVLIQFNVK